MTMWPFFTDVNNYDCIGYQRDTRAANRAAPAANRAAPATIPPQNMYVTVPIQQLAYPQSGMHPAAMPHASASEDKTNLVSE